MKRGMIGILNNPAMAETSHSAGVVYIMKELMECEVLTQRDNWNEYAELIIFHGANFRPGSYNVIGGLNEGVFERVKKLQEYDGKVYSLDGFDMQDFIKKRKLTDIKYEKTISPIATPMKKNLAIGDSHILSVWPSKEYEISRTDGKTIFGYLKNPPDLSRYDKLIFYFGNIDLRFHLMRQSDPTGATRDLFNRYVDYLKSLKKEVAVTQLLPVEHESRKLPGTGLYKGEKYFGSREDRMKLRTIAHEILDRSGLNVLRWPMEWVDENGMKMFEYMEPKQSVHLKPKFYMRNLK